MKKVPLGEYDDNYSLKILNLKHNIWKKQPSWKKVFSKDDSNISSPGGWSQEELTKRLFSILTKQAVGSFWNDVKRK